MQRPEIIIRLLLGNAETGGKNQQKNFGPQTCYGSGAGFSAGMRGFQG